MKWMLIIAGVLTILVIGVGGYAFMLPPTVTSNREATIAAPTDRIFALVTDVAGQSKWRRDIGQVTVTADGATWTERTKDGQSIHFTLVRKDPNSVFEITYQSSLGFSGHWIGEFTARDANTTVFRIKETTTTPSVIGRLLGRVFAPPGSHIDLYVEDLERALRAPS
ncbi:SRPBCC family protein [Phenylobacterium sp.]|jgi:hypothetical protein|uniref:SRPBCC family protein n=1 Tax=Phenylobacterium sp. TaxID=1871053 RepID=UPI0037CC21C0